MRYPEPAETVYRTIAVLRFHMSSETTFRGLLDLLETEFGVPFDYTELMARGGLDVSNALVDAREAQE